MNFNFNLFCLLTVIINFKTNKEKKIMVNLASITSKVLPFLKTIGPKILSGVKGVGGAIARGLKGFGSRAIKGVGKLKNFFGGGGFTRALQRGSEISKKVGENIGDITKVVTPIATGLALAESSGLLKVEKGSKGEQVLGGIQRLPQFGETAQDKLFGLSNFLKQQTV